MPECSLQSILSDGGTVQLISKMVIVILGPQRTAAPNALYTCLMVTGHTNHLGLITAPYIYMYL